MEAPPVITPVRRRSVSWLAIGLPVIGTVAAVVVLFLFNPTRYGFYPRCTLYTTTGLYCPGCGSLRALHQLSHGHVLTALRFNPLLILSVPFVCVYAVRWIRCWAAGAPLPDLGLRPGWFKWAVIGVVLFTILRNIPCEPFIYLAPP